MSAKRGRPTLPDEIHQERLELWKQGLNDREIGERLFMFHGSVYEWRKKHRLGRNDRRGGAISGRCGGL